MRIARLASGHDLSRFDSGVKRLDDWLRNHSAENDRRNLSRTFVLVDDEGDVAGYHSLTMGGVRPEELPAKLGRGLPRYAIGMVLIARLAVAVDRQGQGLGRDLLVDAIHTAARAGEHAAARFVAVDPIDDSARAFYAAHGFVAIPGDEGGRMYMRIDEALVALDDSR